MVKTEDTPAPVKKRSPNRLLVDEATNDDNSVRAAASGFRSARSEAAFSRKCSS